MHTRKSTSIFANDSKNQARVKRFTEETMAISTGESRTMCLGAYDFTESMPKFDINYDPELSNNVEASLERIDIPGKPRYIMVCHFQNFSNVPCNITVRLRK